MTATRTYAKWGIAVTMAFAVSLTLLNVVKTEAAGETPILGYAWSDTIGWIDLNCANTNSCGAHNFGLSVAQNGDISGYAWSEHLGWVSANSSDLSGCPSGACKAKLSGNNLQGWMRVLSQDGNGWDGWISLSGSGYGPTVSNGNFSGYAWGSDVVGWVDWSLARTAYGSCTPSTTYTCSDATTLASTTVTSTCATSTTYTTCSYQCAANACITPPPPTPVPDGGFSGALQAVPSLVRSGNPTKLHWNINYVSACTVTGGGISWSGAVAGCGNDACTSGSGGKATGAITQQTLFTLTCTGLDSSVTTSSATVNILPVFQEL